MTDEPKDKAPNPVTKGVVVYDFNGELKSRPGVEVIDGSNDLLREEDKVTDEDRRHPLAGLFGGKLDG